MLHIITGPKDGVFTDLDEYCDGWCLECDGGCNNYRKPKSNYMAGTKDIAVILKARNPEKYKAIIERAANNGYHDHKFMNIPGHPEYGDCLCPKVQLVEDLNEFPELSDIKRDVINGKYDEPADEQDKREMRGWLIADGASDQMFHTLGLTPPTAAERMFRRQVDN